MATWLITGCSSGLGRNLAQAVLKAGHNAVITARNIEKLKDIASAYPTNALSVQLDVTDDTQIEETVRIAEEKFGTLDILVNNAGYGYRAAVEEGDKSQVADLFATNFFGAVAMIKAVLPSMRFRRHGTIVNITSIAARRAMTGSGYYSATKFALEGLSDALRRELEPLGIRVMIVEPGAFRTDFAGRSLQGSLKEISDYTLTVGPRRKGNDKSSGKQPGDPARAADILLDMIVGRENLPVRLLLGSDAVRIVSSEIEAQIEEIRDWGDVSIRSDFVAPLNKNTDDNNGISNGFNGLNL